MSLALRCERCGRNVPKNGVSGLCYGCLGEPFPGAAPVIDLIPENGQKAIRSLSTRARNESNLSLRRAGRKNALDLSLEPAPVVETLPLAGQPGVVFKGLSNVLSAYPKVGKTTVTWHSLLDWLPGHRVVYVTEEPELVWRVRLHGFDSFLGHPLGERNESLANLDLLFVAGRPPGELLEEAFGGADDIVIVDTLRHALRFTQEADNSEIAAQVTPWIEAARSADKTFLGLHHQTKAGGEHGRGLAGGHALLGVFDMAIEIDRSRNVPTRRKVSALGRLDPVEDFYYEFVDGRVRAVGEVAAVEEAEVRRRTRESLSLVAREFAAIHEDMDEPRPGQRQVRDALKTLGDSGEAIRSGAGKKGDPYMWKLQEEER